MTRPSPPRCTLVTIIAVIALAPLCNGNRYKTVKSFTVTSGDTTRAVPGTLNCAVFGADYTAANVNYINFNIPNLTNDAEIILSEELQIASRQGLAKICYRECS